MAKALYGHLGAPDPRLVDEVRRLRLRVGALETEVSRLLAERALLTGDLLGIGDLAEVGAVLGS